MPTDSDKKGKQKDMKKNYDGVYRVYYIFQGKDRQVDVFGESPEDAEHHVSEVLKEVSDNFQIIRTEYLRPFENSMLHNSKRNPILQDLYIRSEAGQRIEREYSDSAIDYIFTDKQEDENNGN